MTTIRTCICCGCDDEHACAGGCAWHFQSVVHPDLGICTNCEWEILDQDPEQLVAEAVESWIAASPDLAADRADAGELILPDDPEFAHVLRGHR